MLFDSNVKIWLSTDPSDMRKAINGLMQLVVADFKQSPQSNDLFIFYNRQRNMVKILFWHYNGFCLLHKRLEKDLFKMPKCLSEPIAIDQKQLSRLLEGVHFTTESPDNHDIFY